MAVVHLKKHGLPSSKHLNSVIGAGFAALIVLIIGLLFFAVKQVEQINHQFDNVIQRQNTKTELLYAMRITAQERMILLHQIIAEPDPFVVDELIIRHSKLARKYISARTSLEDMITEQNEITVLGQLNHATRTSQPIQNNILTLVLAGERTNANTLMRDAIKAQQHIFSVIEQMLGIQRNNNAFAAAGAHVIHKKTIQSFWFFGTIGLILSVLTALITFTVVHRQAKKLNQSYSALKMASLEVKQASQAKSEFLSAMNHELRTPLTAIRGAIGLLEHSLVGRANAQETELMRMAHSNTERLLELTNDVLEYSQIEANSIVVKFKRFEPVSVVKDVISKYQQAADNKKLTLTYLVEQEMPITIVNDAVRTRQILSCLLDNAVKFTQKGRITLTLTGSKFGPEADLMICIADTGIGISASDLDQLFESFTQGDGSNTRNFGGTGMGLAMSKRLIEALDGKIWVESELGHGSRFWITIPAKALPTSEQTGSESADIKAG